MTRELDDFASELENARGGRRAIAIADILATSTPLHWDEAVAAMQELLDLITEMRRDDIPAFEDVVIQSDGTLSIRTQRRGERGAVAAGRALHALLTTADVPVALRLFVTQANAPETHDSLAAFAKGLAYFGKSDRAALIRALYERYKPTAMASVATAVRAATPPPPPPPVDPRSQRVGTSHALRRGLAIVAVIAVIASAAVIAVLFARSRNGAAAAAPDSTSKAATDAPPNATGTKTTKAQTKLAPAATASRPRVAEARAPEATPATQAHTNLPAAPSAVATPTVRSRRTMPPVPNPPAETAHVDPATPASLAELLAQPAAPVATGATKSANVSERGGAVYSRDDVDVQPPVMLQPQLPPPLMIGGPSEGLINRMELVVAADGTVERVRLTSAPRRMADMMLLSGAKLWKFAPAIKDGVPVRYRTTVTWAVFP